MIPENPDDSKLPEDEEQKLRKIISCDATRFLHFNGS